MADIRIALVVDSLRKEVFSDADGAFAGADTGRFLQGWMDHYVAWVRKNVA